MPSLDPLIKAIPGEGTYVLHLKLKSSIRIAVGSLGVNRFESGRYAYVGRAFGPGGLAARLAHHLRRSTSPHWHVDYLRAQGIVRQLWYSRNAPACEHQWARSLMHMPGVKVPVNGFGSSDCRCVAHLVQFVRRPRKATFRRHLLRLYAGVAPPIHCIQIASPAHIPATQGRMES